MCPWNENEISIIGKGDESTPLTAEAVIDKKLKKMKEKQEAEAAKKSSDSIGQKLSDFCNEPRLKIDDDLFQYWEKQKKDSNYSVLYPLAQAVLGIPFTQTSVERLFSVLKFVHSSLRTSLQADIVDDIIFLHGNFEKLYSKSDLGDGCN